MSAEIPIPWWVWAGVLVLGGAKGAALFKAEAKNQTGPCFNCERPVRVGESICPHCGASLKWG